MNPQVLVFHEGKRHGFTDTQEAFRYIYKHLGATDKALSIVEGLQGLAEKKGPQPWVFPIAAKLDYNG